MDEDPCGRFRIRYEEPACMSRDRGIFSGAAAGRREIAALGGDFVVSLLNIQIY
jgi:hypothetical protein